MNDTKVIGSVELDFIRWDKKECSICRFLIAEEFRSNGKGTKALKAILEYAYNILDMHSINLNVFDFNRAALRCYTKLGFIEYCREKRENGLIVIKMRIEKITKKKMYLDQSNQSESNGCSIIFMTDVEIVPAGVTIRSMSVRDKDREYQKYANEYDIHFIFEDNVPQIEFYTIPQVDILATDSNGGFIGTIGQQSDMKSNAQICYIDRQKNCFLIADNAAEFIKNASHWKANFKAYNGIIFYASKDEAENELEFINRNTLENY